MIKQGSLTAKKWHGYLKTIEKATYIDTQEGTKEKEARIKYLLSNYGAFLDYYLPNYAKAKSSKKHIEIANCIKKHRYFRGILEAYRAFGKSVHGTLGIPLWLMFQDEMHCMLLIGQTETKANRLLNSIKAQLQRNQRIINDFGQQVTHGNWAEGEFTTVNGIAFFAIGHGQDPRSIRKDEFRPDFIASDDLDSKKLSKNPKLVKEAVEYIEEDVLGTFDIGIERYLHINSRISKNSILAKLVEKFVENRPKGEKWHYWQIKAVDNKGRSTWPEKYPDDYWRKKKQDMTMRAWEKEYMCNPIEEGTVFKYDWIRWKKLPKLQNYDYHIVYCDPSFTHNSKSDYKAIKWWGKIGTELHLIRAFVRQCSIKTMVQVFYDWHESTPSDVIVQYWIEANMLQAMLLDEFYYEGITRGYQLAIRGDTRKKPDKFQRIEGLSPLYERGYIIYNERLIKDSDMQRGIEQLLAIESGTRTPDDSPDADEGAIFLLQKRERADAFELRIGRRSQRPNGW